MAVRKEFDEMADRYLLLGDEHTVSEEKRGSAVFGLYVSARFVDLKQGGDTLWIVCKRRDTEWHWARNAQGILMIAGNRAPFAGNLMVAETFWSDPTWLHSSTLQVLEEVHIRCTPSSLQIVDSELRDELTIKVRINAVDFTLPQGVLQDMRAIHQSLSRGSYGID